MTVVIAGVLVALLIPLGLSEWSQWHYPALSAVPPLDGDTLPTISLVMPVRNERSVVEQTLSHLSRLAYPSWELIVVDDGSDDGTGEVVRAWAARTALKIRVVTVSDLPPDWLGKPHAAWVGAETAAGEWLLFMDADSILSPESLHQAMGAVERFGLDYLTVIPNLQVQDFWARAFLSFFGLVLALSLRPWLTNQRWGKTAMGIGAFQLVRRQAYVTCGGHRSLALAVADDVEPGSFLKRSGFRTYCLLAGSAVRVAWYQSIGEITRGFEKNLYSMVGFSPVGLFSATVMFVLWTVGPWAVLVISRGPLQLLAGIVVLLTLAEYVRIGKRGIRLPWWAAVVYPLEPFVFLYILWRGAAIAERQGGIRWRDRFYALATLRRGRRPSG